MSTIPNGLCHNAYLRLYRRPSLCLDGRVGVPLGLHLCHRIFRQLPALTQSLEMLHKILETRIIQIRCLQHKYNQLFSQYAHTNTMTHRHTNTMTHRHANTMTHRHTNTMTHRHTNTMTHRHTNTMSHRKTNNMSHRHTNTMMHRHTNTMTHRH